MHVAYDLLYRAVLLLGMLRLLSKLAGISEAIKSKLDRWK